MSIAPTIDEIASLRRWTGMPLLYCRTLLRDTSPSMRQKLLLAVRTQEGAKYLRDPIEVDPVFATAFEQATEEANRLIKEFVAAERAKLQAEGMGQLDFMFRHTSHLYWSYLKRLLKERHAVDWLSPAEMNPWIHFD
ncbi:hypothetical protein NA78x_004767 [Anatilimnocola sp. NA78]|uniref:hypothetical protein n=1 Tax=Anatilimnocola sp. NA78 TaxID=3415683 RepID=UPI003CE4764B